MSVEAITLPPMEYTFNLSVKGNETKQLFEGTFIYKRPSLGMRSEIGRIRTALGGDQQNIADEVKYLNAMLSTLQVCLTQTPDWWRKANNGRDLYDINVVEEVFLATLKFEEEWLKKLNPEVNVEPSK